MAIYLLVVSPTSALHLVTIPVVAVTEQTFPGGTPALHWHSLSISASQRTLVTLQLIHPSKEHSPQLGCILPGASLLHQFLLCTVFVNVCTSPPFATTVSASAFLSHASPLSVSPSLPPRLINLYSAGLSLNLLQWSPSPPVASPPNLTTVLWCSPEETIWSDVLLQLSWQADSTTAFFPGEIFSFNFPCVIFDHLHDHETSNQVQFQYKKRVLIKNRIAFLLSYLFRLNLKSPQSCI